jgi:hypothetical protein
MTQVRMFFKSEPAELEETVRKWLEGSRGLIGEVINVAQCEYTDLKTNVRGVLFTILYRIK